MQIFTDGHGCRIAYAVYGSRGDTVVLLHGGFGTGHTHFANEIPLLAEHHIVYVLDFPGYGQSAPPNRTYGVDFYQRDAADIITFIRALKVGSVHLVGFSDGGEVAMLIAIEAPELVKSIVQWGACGQIPDTGTGSGLDNLVPVSAWGPEMDELRTQIVTRHGEAQLVSMVEGYVAALIAIRTRGGDIALSQAHRIQCPVVIIHGERDAYVSTEVIHLLAARIPRCTVHLYPDAGHFVQDDAPTQLHSIMEEALK